MFCPSCGNQVPDGTAFCPKCGKQIGSAAAQQPQAQPQPVNQQVVIQNVEKKSNGIGIAGFVFALVAVFLGWVPILNWVLWAIGALLSIIGLFKKPRGFAVAGFVISFISVILLIVLFGALAGTAGLAALSM